MQYDIELRELGTRPIACQRRTLRIDELSEFFGRVFTGLSALLAEFGVPLVGTPFAIYHGVDQDQVDVEAAIPLGGYPPGGTPKAMDGRLIIFRELEGGTVAYTEHVGPYERLDAAYEALRTWVRERGYEPTGTSYEVYLSNPEEETDPEKWRTEVYLPVT